MTKINIDINIVCDDEDDDVVSLLADIAYGIIGGKFGMSISKEMQDEIGGTVFVTEVDKCALK